MNIKNRCVPCGKVEGWLERIIAIEEQGIALNNEVNNIWDSLGLQGTIVEYLMLEVDAIKSDYQAKIDQEVKTTSTPTFAGIITSGLVDGVDISAFKAEYDLIKSDYESLKSDYQAKINQEVKTTSTPTFAGIITPGLVDGVDISAFKAEYDSFSSSIEDIIVGQFNLDLLAINVDKDWNNKSITNINNLAVNGTINNVDIASFKSDYDSKINQGVKTTSWPTFNGLAIVGGASISDIASFAHTGATASDNVTIGLNRTNQLGTRLYLDIWDAKNHKRGGINVGSLKIDGTEVIDLSRNLINIGTIGCGAVVPSADNAYDLGSQTKRFRTIFLGNGGDSYNNAIRAGNAITFANLDASAYQAINTSRIHLRDTSGQIRCDSDITLCSLNGASWKGFKANEFYIQDTKVIDSSRNLVNIGNITVSGICTGLAVRGVTDLNVTASANYRNKHDAEIFWNEPYTTSPGTMYYEKKKTIKFPAGLGPGTYRVYYESKVETPNIFCHSRIYKNGIALGTERSTFSDSYVSFTEDFTGPLEPGSTIELWAYKRGVGDYYSKKVYLRNFRIGYDLSMPTAMPSNNS